MGSIFHRGLGTVKHKTSDPAIVLGSFIQRVDGTTGRRSQRVFGEPPIG